MDHSEALLIAGTAVMPGERRQLALPAAQLFTQTPLEMPVEVIRGKKPGPVLLVCGAIHGNELNGVEIIRRLRTLATLKRLRGTLILVPVVNLHGYINKSRYLPDRRDLNRCFPGSPAGSVGSRIANLFFDEIVSHCTHIIDLHTAAVHRDNLPQIRADLSNDAVADMAAGFGIPVIVNAGLIERSLRCEAGNMGIPVITYEAGEALRLSERAIVTGVRGIVSTMRSIRMLPAGRPRATTMAPNIAIGARWHRAPEDGVFRPLIDLGAKVRKGDTLGFISSAFNSNETAVEARVTGVVVGINRLPLVNEGEALFNVGIFEAADDVEEDISLHADRIEDDPLFEPDTVADIDLA